MQFDIVPLKHSELKELYDLIKLVFSNDYSYVVAKTKWAFENEHSHVLVAKHEGKIIASRGGFNWPLAIDGTEIKAIQFHGTSVHPDYRRKGLFTMLNKAYLKYAAENNYDYIFNVSVQASMLGYKKLNWNYLKGYHRLTAFHNPIKFAYTKIKKLQAVKRVVQFRDLEAIPQRFLDARSEQFRNVIHSNYDMEFLSWRLNNPEENYRTYSSEDAFVIYKIKQTNVLKELIFGDFFLIKKSWRAFSRALNQIIKLEKPDISYTYISESHPYYKFYLTKFYFPNPLNYHLNFGTRLIDESNDKFIGRQWAMSFLDIDTF